MLDRAREILSRLESEDVGGKGKKHSQSDSAYQISLFSPGENKLQDLLSNVDPEKLTPLDALSIIYQLKKLADGQKGSI